MKLKQKALLTLQFYLDRQKTLCFLIDYNPKTGDELHDGFSTYPRTNMLLFGNLLAKCDLLDKEDKESLANFCQSYLDNYKK